MIQYFLILGLKPGATPEQLKKAWRRLCIEHHPDKGGDPIRFREITHAYRILSDPSYNRDRSGWENNLTFAVQRAINFSDAFFGTTITISYARVIYDSSHRPVTSGSENMETISFHVNVPPGSNGTFQHLEAGAGIRVGDSVGHAVVTVYPQPHPKFAVVGRDVLAREQIPLNMMISGGSLEVSTMWGVKTLKVLPGTKPGDKIPIPKCGVEQVGAHFVIVDPIFPGEEDLKQDTWKGLNINWNIKEEMNADEEYMELFERLSKDTKFTIG